MESVKASGVTHVILAPDDLIALINLAEFGQYYLNMRDFNEGPKADEFQEKATAQVLETGHIPAFAEYCKMMHEEAAK